MSAYIKMIERSQINDLMLHLKLLEKHEQAKPKTSRRREIIKKIRAKINESKQNHENRQYQTTGEENTRNQRVTLIQLHTIKPLKTIQRINEIKSWFSKK
jgi:hypothetical protein